MDGSEPAKCWTRLHHTRTEIQSLLDAAFPMLHDRGGCISVLNEGFLCKHPSMCPIPETDASLGPCIHSVHLRDPLHFRLLLIVLRDVDAGVGVVAGVADCLFLDALAHCREETSPRSALAFKKLGTEVPAKKGSIWACP